jgi:SAM-dependent methyltransferase
VIDPADVIARHSVEELLETADQYFRAVNDPSYLMVKPFASLHEAPDMLENLGRLFAGLELGRAMTVLDFGAGSCWLSRWLAQLNCQPICCDASAAALEIGRRVFAELPLVGTVAFAPRFLLFNGHHLDLPPESVDRIISFDAFHHVPNQQEVLSEFGRVLRPGGVAGFSEPGPRHSQTPLSQYEMRNHRVLENDIILDDIFEQARRAGFTDLKVAVMSDLLLSLDDRNRIYRPAEREAVKSAIFNNVHDTMFDRSIFFLHKGPLRRDSRSHVGLAHHLSIVPTDVARAHNAPVDLTFRIVNTGQARWLHEHTEIFGVVRLASHLYDEAGQLLTVDFSRHGLPRSVEPGESIEVTHPFVLPDARPYRLVFDLVAEGVSWFENLGSRPVEVHVRSAD